MRKVLSAIAAVMLMAALPAGADEIRFDIESRTDRFGADYSAFAVPDNNLYACVEACRSDTKCQAFTFGSGPQWPQPMCWLKSGAGTKKDHPHCTSGLKKTVPVYFSMHLGELTLEKGVDIPGGDYRSFPLDRPEASLCRARCSEDDQCAGYTYVNPNVQGPAALCYLKNNPGKTATNDRCTSGLRTYAVEKLGDVTLEPDTDRFGLDYKGVKLDTPDPRLCADACRNDLRCRAYTYVVNGYRGPQAECYLKDQVPQRSGNISCVSGVKIPDSGVSSSVTRGDRREAATSCTTSLADDIFSTICTLIPNTSCSVTKKDCKKYTRQLYLGSRFAPSTQSQVAKWNSLGGRGKLLGEAALCAFKELSPKAVIAGTNQPGGPLEIKGGSGLTYRQKIGFLHFDPVKTSFDGYRSLSVCAPILGCYDAISQDISLKLESYSPTPRLTAGDGGPEVAAFYGLTLTTETSRKAVDIKLPSITVATPVGPLSVEPAFNYASHDAVSDSPFDGSETVKRLPQDEPGWYRQTLLKDIYGVDNGIAFPVLYPGFLKYGGWNSVVALGTRDPSKDGSVWPGGTDRPDRDIKVARSAAEKEPSVEMVARARVTIGLDALKKYLPSFPGFDISLSIFVEPQARAAFSSELSLVGGEAAVPPTDIGAGGTWSFSDFAMKTVAAGSLGFTIETGMDLVIKTMLGTVVNTHPRWPINLSEKPSTTPGKTAYFGASAGPWLTSEPREFTQFKTFHSPHLTGELARNANTYVAACLDPGKKVPDEPAPQPTATPGDPKKLFDEAEWPCNLCIYADSQHAAVLFQVAVPSPNKKWYCDMKVKSGCYDICTMNTETGALTFKRSADKNLVFPDTGYTGEVCHTPLVR